MLVSLNPGAPMGRESRLLQESRLICPTAPAADFTTGEHADLLLRLATAHYQHLDEGQDSIFHKKSLGYARLALALLDRGKDPGNDGALRHCWFTDAYKCSTRDEVGPRIDKEAFRLCLEHLKAELAYFKPRVVLALGGRAHWALEKMLGKHCMLPTTKLVRVRHPSNGCPKLHSAQLDEAANELNVASGSATLSKLDLATLRRQIHESLFGTVSTRLLKPRG